MIDLRDMELLIALSRERHFARAAAASGISQPALSMRIKNIEDNLGVPIVRRANRFEGFTPEGDIVLRWARRMLDDARAMGQEINSARGAVEGHLNIGTIPTALPFAARLPARMAAAHPGIKLRTFSVTSLQVQHGIDEGEYDIGITYEDGIDADLMELHPLYVERYVLVTPQNLSAKDGAEIAWADIGDLPLSLLVPQMQNRRILNGLFEAAGARPNIVAETNAFSASLVQVREGFAATILPDAFLDWVDLKGVNVLPLIDPVAEKPIALVRAKRAAMVPAVQVLLEFLNK